MGNRGTSTSQFTRCVIARNGSDGLYYSSSGNIQLTMDHSVLAHNGGSYGIYVSAGAYPQLIENSIIWGNLTNLQCNNPTFVTVRYSDIGGGCQGGVVEEGNIDADPSFADSGAGDFHLKSGGGTWNGSEWVRYPKEEHSPCIDAGDPELPWEIEPKPNGKRINMGRYGNTVEASKEFARGGAVFFMR